MNEPVLVLNRNFEPINVCNTQRAVGLLMVGKAELIENGRGYIRAPASVFPRPSVIRLAYMIRRPRPKVKLTKREIFRRDDYVCQYCGQPSARPTVDHIIPRFRGGEYSWENLVTACPQCNRRKGGKTLQEVHMLLRRRPTEPQPTAEYLYGRQAHDASCAEWRKYLEGW
jgi:5-methylcytosine-specific restriction endonuclease McrA